MGVFFRFTKEGKIVVAKNIHQNMSDKQFASIAKEISKEAFFSRYSEDKEHLEEKLEMVKKLRI